MVIFLIIVILYYGITYTVRLALGKLKKIVKGMRFHNLALTQTAVLRRFFKQHEKSILIENQAYVYRYTGTKL